MNKLQDKALDILEDAIWGHDVNEIPDRLRKHVREMDKNIISMFVWSILLPAVACIIMGFLYLVGRRH